MLKGDFSPSFGNSIHAMLYIQEFLFVPIVVSALESNST